ncbi:MAG: leucine-rich repeat domain-containing protein [Rikenellaceae bacterium]|nr:leucine-rich repeat domain-containing protein [Rikenellaceae bacterium]
MKHNYTLLGLLAAVALVFAVGCSKSDKDEVLLSQTQTETATEGEKNYLYATIEDEESRTFVNENQTICWHAEDEVSAFCNTTTNAKYTFLGEDGDKGGMFYGSSTGGDWLEYFYALYPYNTEATMIVDGDITTTLPYLQGYIKDSFGKGANTMVAVVRDGTKKLVFNNLCGYLKIKLYGNNVKIKSLVLQGNNGEKLSGAATISAPYGAKPSVTMAADATEKVMINCESGVTLGTTAGDATTFWFALPPTTFEKGITITAYTTDGLGFTQSTSNKVTITRNRIQPMSAVEAKNLAAMPIPLNQIWYTSSDNSAITLYNSSGFDANVVSNTYEDGLGVITFDEDISTIGNSAFYQRTSLTSVTTPESIASIGDSAFYGCTSLTKFEIPDKLTAIGNSVFSGCTSLKSIALPYSVTSIGNSAFYQCTSLTAITIPDSVTSIGSSAFNGCNSLTNTTIGKGVATIGEYAFGGCTGDLVVNCNIPEASSSYGAFYGSQFTKVTIGNGVTSVGAYAFYGCDTLRSVTIGNSVEAIRAYAFYDCGLLKSVTIPDSVKEIGNGAFAYSDLLTKVIIGSGVTSMGVDTFRNCDSLTSVTISNGVALIGVGAFSACDSLATITIPDSVTSIGGDAFSYCTSLTSVTIPNSVTSIGGGAFRDCTSLTSVTIGNSVTEIGGRAFEYCSSLTSVTIGNSVTSIGYEAFDDCGSLNSVYISDLSAWCKISFDNYYANPLYNGAKLYLNGSELTDITIPSDITEIKAYAFYNCTSLTSVTIGNSVTSIGNWAFIDCTSLKSVYCKPTTPPTGGIDMFYDNASGRKIYVPAGTESKYKSARYWSDYSSYIYGVIFTDENEPVN